MGLDDIVNVTITTQTTSVSRVGFGTPLVMAFHNVFTERARVYTSVSAMISDGFATTDAAVLAVTAIFAQNPKVIQVVVGRQAPASPTVRSVVCSVDTVQADTIYSVTIEGPDTAANTATFDSGATPTAITIAAGLVSAIAGLANSVTVTDNIDGTFDIDGSVGQEGLPFAVITNHTFISQQNTSVDDGIVADIAAVRLENDDWYSIHLTSQSDIEVQAAAAFIETLRRIMVVSSSDSDILTTSTTDLGSDLQTSAFARTILIWSNDAFSFSGAAWAGKILPNDPGSVTWKFKTLAGVPVDSDISTTEIGNLEGKSVNHYTLVAGVNITQQGVSSADEFIDITRFVDFVTARLQEFVFAQLVNSLKIPFTDPGIAVIEAEVRAVLNLGITTGGLTADPAPTVTVPLAADVAAVDKAARTLPDVTFTAVLAGAIHNLTITGTISV